MPQERSTNCDNTVTMILTQNENKSNLLCIGEKYTTSEKDPLVRPEEGDSRNTYISDNRTVRLFYIFLFFFFLFFFVFDLQPSLVLYYLISSLFSHVFCNLFFLVFFAEGG